MNFFKNPKNIFLKKYPNNIKGKPLHTSLISLYGKQILEALNYLHTNKWYHLHIHSGNILIDERLQKIKISDLENFVCDLPIKNEQYYNYIFEELTMENSNKKIDGNNGLFSDIFKNQSNIFEKIDIVSFGRILYEMCTGKELKSTCPDELEYTDMDIEISNILRLIFLVKTSKYQNNFILSVPEVSASELLKIKFFNYENNFNIKESENISKKII